VIVLSDEFRAPVERLMQIAARAAVPKIGGGLAGQAELPWHGVGMPVHSFATAIGPCSIWWEGDVVTRFMLLTAEASSIAPPAWLGPLLARVQKHLREGGEDFGDVAMDWDQVTPFQRRVYQAALQTKSGQTATYGDLAQTMGEAPGASRAVGTALGQNPWPLLVPCHRFVGAHGKMTGFSAPGGIDTKLKLLAIEGNQLFGV